MNLRPLRTAALLFIAMSAVGSAHAAPVSLLSLGSTYSENFDSLSRTAGSTTNTALPTGWALTESGGGARDNEQYAVDTGGSTTGDIYSYGAAGSTDRALGTLRSGTLIPTIGVEFFNKTGATITALDIAFTGEQWRLGAAGRSDRLDFQYSTNASSLTTGTYVDVDALDFVGPSTPPAGAKDGNASANSRAIAATITGLNIASNTSFWLRWNDFDATGADDGLAIDNFFLTARSATAAAPNAVPEPGSLVLAGAALLGMVTTRRCSRG